MYAIFKDKKQVTKAHSTKEAIMTEAFENKLAYYRHPDFSNDTGGLFLMNEYEIQELPEMRDKT